MHGIFVSYNACHTYVIIVFHAQQVEVISLCTCSGQLFVKTNRFESHAFPGQVGCYSAPWSFDELYEL